MSEFIERIDREITLEKMIQRRGRSKWHRNDPDVIPFMLADTDYPVPKEIEEAALGAVKDQCWNYSWFPESLEAMAETARTKHGIVDATVNDLLVTPGVSPCIKLSAIYACKPGDEIVVTSAMYPPFLRAVEYVRAKPLYHELHQEDNWKFDPDELNELITHKTRLIYVCNPHNPTGRVMTKEELKGIADIGVDNNLLVASDELHSDIVFDGRKHISIASLGPEIADRTISMFGLSKTFGLAGLQIGWLVSTNKLIMEDLRKIAYGLIRGTSSISLAVAHAVLTKCQPYIKPLVNYMQNLRDIGFKRLNSIEGVKVTKPEGTYVFWPDISSYGLSSTEMTKHLIEEGRVAVTNGANYGPGGEGHVRIVYPTSKAIFNEGFNRLEAALSKL